jgi:hypothetical protein
MIDGAGRIGYPSPPAGAECKLLMKRSLRFNAARLMRELAAIAANYAQRKRVALYAALPLRLAIMKSK